MNGADPRDLPPIDEPPWSAEAEQSVLGGIMLDNGAYDAVGHSLEPRSFFHGAHSLIYAAIEALICAGAAADPITVFLHLQGQGKQEECGGLPYINDIVASVPSAANIRRYAQVVLERATERRAMAVLDKAMSAIRAKGGDVHAKLDKVQTELLELERRERDSEPAPLGQIVVKQLDAIQEAADAVRRGEATATGYSTGLAALDRMIGGLRGGKVYLIGARPGIGKTALAQLFTKQVSLIGKDPSLYLSQEMTKGEMGNRNLAAEGRINLQRLEAGTLQDEEWGRLSEAVDKLRDAPIYIDDQSGLTLIDIRRKARARKGLKLIVLDYVQLCAGLEEDEKDSTRNQILEAISRGTKQLAKELDCAVVVLSALNRAVDERKYGRASMKDFKDCGALEADADVILSLFKIRKLEEQEGDLVGIDILKQRAGPTGSVAVYFWKPVMQWGSTDYVVDDILSAPSGKKESKEL